MFYPQPPINDLSEILAYLDPGSGSFLVQMLIAAFIGGGIMLRAFWSRLFGKKNMSEDEPAGHNNDDEKKKP
ncbi:MAG TPA: hypothetical protein VIS72_11450 [Anaerolineales bacterium]